MSLKTVQSSFLALFAYVFLLTTPSLGTNSVESVSNTEMTIDFEKIEDARRKVASYEAACHKLQGVADWMSTALRIKSSISKSASERKQARLINSTSGNLTVRSQEFKNPTKMIADQVRSNADSCSSLKNLYSSARAYVQWQTELMKTKAALGGDAVKTRMAKLNDTPNAIKKRMGGILPPISFMNRTSTELLDSLKVATTSLAISLDEQRKKTLSLIRDAGKSRDFLGYLNAIKNRMIFRLNDLVETSESLRKTQNILLKGEVLAVLNNAFNQNDGLKKPKS